MHPPVFERLKAWPAAVAKLGATPKVYRRRAPQGVVPPYVTWFVVTDVPENNLSDVPTVDRAVLQIDVYTAANAGVDELADIVRDAIEPVAHMTGIVVDERETDTNLDRIGLQFDWWLSR